MAVDPIAEFRKFAAGETDTPVDRELAQAVVRHIDALIECVAERDRAIEEQGADYFDVTLRES